MKIKNFNIGEVITPLSAVLVALQSNKVFQVIQLALTIIGLVITIAYSLWKWKKEAMKDGVLDENELKQLGNIVDDAKKGINEIKEQSEANDGNSRDD